jgi:hypothetical protein
MEQSVLPRLETENSKEEVAPEKRSPADPQALLALFEAQVPVSLHRFGRTVEASAVGSPSRPPVVVLGGISANRFPALRADGGAGWCAKSDQLVLPEQLRHLADRLGGPAKLHLLDSLFGHDMFLKEADRIGALIQPFLARQG